MARITQPNAKAERVLTHRELNRALLERQLLLGRRRLATPGAIERLCALQAQYSLSPYIALWSRVTGFRKDQLTRALEERTVVKSTLFRITLHMTSARDYPYFAEAWLGVDLPTREEGAKHLVRRYLASFGPATQQDLLRFVGVRVGDLRPDLERLELRKFRDERGRELLDLPGAALPEGDTPAPVRFL